MPNVNYNETLQRTISYLDAIFGKIVEVTNGNDVIINGYTITASHMLDGTIPVSAYSGIIDNLAYIPPREVNNVLKVIKHRVENRSSGTIAGSISYANPSEPLITGTLSNSGYYDRDTVITMISGVTPIQPVFSGNLGAGLGDGYAVTEETTNNEKNYVISLSNNYITPKFKIAKGTLNINVEQNKVVPTVSQGSLTVDFSNDSSLSGVTFGQDSSSNRYHITISADPSLSVPIAIEPSYTLNQGYISSATNVGSLNYTLTANASALGSKNYYVNIAKGSCNVSTTAFSVNLSASDVTLYNSTTTGREFAAITPSGLLDLNVSVSEGYITSGDINQNIDSATVNTKYIELFRYSASSSENLTAGYDTAQDNPYTSTNYNIIEVGGNDSLGPSASTYDNNYIARKIEQSLDKYNDKKILITLNQEAMGEAVSDEITRLENRLLGVSE